MEQDFEELHRLAVAERRTLNDRIAAALRYDRALSELELPPNGDDYNVLMEILTGGPGREPHKEGR